MARQGMHNRRAGRGNTGGGASWISYSDMMAALLLLFVLILCVSLYQYFSMLEQKTRELNEQSQELERQQIILIGKQDELNQKDIELNAKTTELDEKTAALLLAQSELEENQAALIIIQSELDETKIELDQRKIDLDLANAALLINQQQLNDAQERLAQQQLAFDVQTRKIDDLVGVRSKIVRSLSSAMSQSNMKAKVDPNTGDIILESTVFFESGSAGIKPEGQALLEAFIPVYLNVLLSPEYEEYLGEIIIEGHTDSSGGYNTNLKLSQERALQVAMYCMDLPGLTQAQKEKLQSILTAKGKSYSDLKYDAYGNEDKEASRRVEFKFSLRDADMISEMNEILQSDDQTTGIPAFGVVWDE